MNQRDGSQTLMLAGAAEKWMTPVANDDNKTPEAHLAMKARMKGGARQTITSLNVQTQIWQTPGADSFRSRGGERKHEMGLDQQARNWPSPRAEDSESCGNHPGATDSLTGAVTHWATPRSSENENRTTQRAPSHGESHGEVLAGQACDFVNQKWPTPAARDFREHNQHPDQLPDQLPNFVVHSFSLPVLSQESGEPLGSTTRTLRQRLNPAFVCWLMGWPMWWTRAAPISSAAAETAWWRSRLRWHLQCCLDALPANSNT